MNSKNSLLEKSEDLDSIIEELNNVISNENFCNGAYSDLIEIVYSYPDDIINNNGIIWNSTLFSSLGGFNFSDLKHDLSDSVLKKIGEEVLEKLIEVKSLMNNFIRKLKSTNIYSREDLEKRNNSLSILEKDIKIIDIHIAGLPFELEKAGYNIMYSQSDYISAIEELDKLNSFVFPSKVSEDPEMIKEVYNYLYEKYLNKKNELSSDEREDFEFYLNEILKLIPGYFYKIKEKPKLIDNPLLKTKIHRDEYVKMFDIIFSICKVPQRCEICSCGSFNDSDDYFGVPNSNEYKYKTLEEMLLMFIHEPTHYINLRENKKNFGYQKMEGNVEKEEGLAEMLESLFQGHNLNSVSIAGISTPRILIGEILDGDQLIRFTELYRKIGVKKGNLIQNVLRTKRCYPLKYKGAGKKDLSYPYGKKTIRNYLKDNKPKKLLYLGKTSIDYIEGQNKFSPNDIGDEVIYPLIIAELLLYYISNNFHINHEDFIAYMDTKYEFLGLSEFTTIRDKFPDNISHQLNSVRKMVRKTVEKNKIID